MFDISLLATHAPGLRLCPQYENTQQAGRPTPCRSKGSAPRTKLLLCFELNLQLGSGPMGGLWSAHHLIYCLHPYCITHSPHCTILHFHYNCAELNSEKPFALATAPAPFTPFPIQSFTLQPSQQYSAPISSHH